MRKRNQLLVASRQSPVYEDAQILVALRELLRAYHQLMPGLAHISVQDYANINQAPILAEAAIGALAAREAAAPERAKIEHALHLFIGKQIADKHERLGMKDAQSDAVEAWRHIRDNRALEERIDSRKPSATKKEIKKLLRRNAKFKMPRNPLTSIAQKIVGGLK
jgi:hypothetical protein